MFRNNWAFNPLQSTYAHRLWAVNKWALQMLVGFVTIGHSQANDVGLKGSTTPSTLWQTLYLQETRTVYCELWKFKCLNFTNWIKFRGGKDLNFYTQWVSLFKKHLSVRFVTCLWTCIKPNTLHVFMIKNLMPSKQQERTGFSFLWYLRSQIEGLSFLYRMDGRSVENIENKIG